MGANVLAAEESEGGWIVTFYGETWTMPAYIPESESLAVVATWPRVTWFFGHHQ